MCHGEDVAVVRKGSIVEVTGSVNRRSKEANPSDWDTQVVLHGETETWGFKS